MLFYPEDYGAKADGTANDAAAIQKAVDVACKNGGGRVVFSSGKTYYSGGIEIKRNVELHLEIGSVLCASTDLGDYISPAAKMGCTGESDDFSREKTAYAFLYGYRADHCAVTGAGTVNGNCMAFVEKKNKYCYAGRCYPRPVMLYIENSSHITVSGVTFLDAPFWTLQPAGCYDVRIDGVRILNRLDVANSDGIDPDHCQNVRITGCHIECADDCIVIKNTGGNSEYGESRDILISNCTLVSTSAAIKVGTESVNDFRNISADNCIISRSNRGLSIQIRDGGNAENISFSNILIETRRFSDDWWGCAEPIAVTSVNRNPQTISGTVRNVRFKNISCKGENGILLAADAQGKIDDVVFDGVRVELTNTSKWEKGLYDLRPGGETVRSAEPVLKINAVGIDTRGVKISGNL